MSAFTSTTYTGSNDTVTVSIQHHDSGNFTLGNFTLWIRDEQGNAIAVGLNPDQWLDVHRELTAALTAADRAAEVAA